jgi:phosphoribosylformimino-5-aminoimidazole carboxamide ribotide isomerase
MRFRPCIDIHHGRVKQIVGGSLRDAAGGLGKAEADLKENFVSDREASFYAALYRDMALAGGHVIMLDHRDSEYYEATRKQALEALRRYPGGLMAGGGIDPDNSGEYLDAGASHVIVTSYVFREGRIDEKNLEEMVRAAGKDHLVLDLSCRRCQDGNYRVVTDRWQAFTDFVISPENLDLLSASCSEFLIHAADVEGKRGGVEAPLIALLGDWQKRSGFPVTYAGGVHDLKDLDQIRRASDGYLDVTVGSALDLFGGSLSLDDLVKACW